MRTRADLAFWVTEFYRVSLIGTPQLVMVFVGLSNSNPIPMPRTDNIAALEIVPSFSFSSFFFLFFNGAHGLYGIAVDENKNYIDDRPWSRYLRLNFECYRVFTGFYGVSLGFTGFYLVLLGFTGFYLVLLGFTGFFYRISLPFHSRMTPHSEQSRTICDSTFFFRVCYNLRFQPVSSDLT